MLQLARLEGFYWVAKVEGYAKAARAFPYPITQPGVYQQVRKLEEELGETLFERVAKDRVVLTTAGSALYRFVEPFFAGLPGIERTIRSHTYGGTLRIHAADQILRHLLPPWLRKLSAKRADIDIDVHESGGADVGLLLGGATDLLVDHIGTIPERIGSLKVAQVRAFLVLPAHSAAAAKRRRIRPEQLEPMRFIAYHPDRPHHERQLQALEALATRPSRMSYAGTADAILGMVGAGIGFSIVPSLFLKGPQADGVVARRLSFPGTSFPIHACWRKTDVPNPFLEEALRLAPRCS